MIMFAVVLDVLAAVLDLDLDLDLVRVGADGVLGPVRLDCRLLLPGKIVAAAAAVDHNGGVFLSSSFLLTLRSNSCHVVLFVHQF